MMDTWAAVGLVASLVAGADPAAVSLTAPRPYQVVQRVGHDPAAPASGYADIAVRGEFTKGALTEYRVVPLAGATGRAVGWARFDGQVRVPAGGWYRLEVRARKGEEITQRGAVEPVGVGEVFLVAGQSYATNCNDEQLKVGDVHGRVAAWDEASGRWAVAHDPQPAPDGSDGGSIWPPLGDALVKEFRVPVGFANVAVGATASGQWMPGGKLHPRLVRAGAALGRFRAVLWQQGESDVIAKTTGAKYVENVKAIRTAMVRAVGVDAPWVLAKSTHHPTVYNDPAGEGRIRAAVDQLTRIPGFEPGPDTDTLKGDSRGGPKSRRHFSALGQRRAAEMWLAVLKRLLTAPRPLRETVSELQLLSPAWSSPVVHCESSVLLRLRPGGPTTARLAFPAAYLIDVVSADRRHRFDPSDVTLSDDGLTLTFRKPGPVEVIRAEDLFPPKDSPNSYRHRTGHPEQNLLYRPGRWFHDRDVEVTYRRREVPPATPKVPGSLPKTVARLKAGKALTLGISGDSISTGLDASALTKAPPNQPGYPDLVSAQLRATFGCDVVLRNRAVSGWSVANGVKDLEKLLASKPDLIIVAYGMNDVGRRDPKWFGRQTRTILDRVRAAAPEAEVILVAPMLGHGEWVHTPREMFSRYREELRALSGPGVALADVTALWQQMLRNKHDLDLTGNGLNHPNDFGHRLYAQAVLACLIRPAKGWGMLPPLPDREGFAGSFAGVSGDALLVAGGANFPDKKPWEGGTKGWHDRVFVLPHPGASWEVAGRLPRPLGYGVSVTHRGGVVCVGGSDAMRHHGDAFRLEWKGGKVVRTPLPPLPCPLANGCGALVGSVLYVVGGQESPTGLASAKGFAIDLDAPKLTWSTLPAFPGGGRMLATAAAAGGALYVVGGVSLVEGKGTPERRYHKDAHRFDPKAGWKRVADLPHPLAAAPSPAPATADGFHILGGDDGSQVGVPPARHLGFRNTVLRYDLNADRWEVAGDVPAPRVTVPLVRWGQAWVIPSGEARPGVRSPEVWSVLPGSL